MTGITSRERKDIETVEKFIEVLRDIAKNPE
jgi:hypothetical protein